MELVLLIIQVIIALLLIISVLIQRSDSDGLGGLGSGGGGGLLSSRGQANLMTRTTAILAFLFMANSLLLGIITARETSSSIVDEVVAEQPIQAPKDGLDNQKPQAPKDGMDKVIPQAPEDKATTPVPDKTSGEAVEEKAVYTPEPAQETNTAPEPVTTPTPDTKAASPAEAPKVE
jgi:preprotein translocase subunit SecG